MASESPRQRLPFEPGSKGAETPKKKAKSAPTPPVKATPKPSASGKKNSPKKSSASAPTAIPEAVSNRMLRRMLVFSGVPTGAGVVTFLVSYYLVINHVVELPSYFVLLATLGCFGLGVVGLTYGVLSASWDEDRPGNLLGLDEFQVNFGRMTSAWGAKSDR